MPWPNSSLEGLGGGFTFGGIAIHRGTDDLAGGLMPVLTDYTSQKSTIIRKRNIDRRSYGYLLNL
jgi:hypothetical protein